MPLLARLEADLRAMLARAFPPHRAAIGIRDLGRALLDEDEAAGQVPVGGRVLVVGLAPGDLEALDEDGAGLAERLGQLVSEERERRYGSAPAGAPLPTAPVELRADPAMSAGRFRVAVADPRQAESGGGTADTAGPRLVLTVGGSVVPGTQTEEGRPAELVLGRSPVLLGSAPEATMRLPAELVRPRHLEIAFDEAHDGHVARAVADAPFQVNGQPASEALLTDGTRLGLGEVDVLYRLNRSPRDDADSDGGRQGGEGGGPPVQA